MNIEVLSKQVNLLLKRGVFLSKDADKCPFDLLNRVERAMFNIVNIRNYKTEHISEEIMQMLYQGFSYGPSVANHQPWEILQLHESQKKEIVEATLDPFLTENSFFGQTWIENAPVVLIVFMDQRRSEARIGERGHIFSKQDIFSAIQNMRVVASLNGLGTSVIREFDSKRLKEMLQVPRTYHPIAIVTVGYPDEEPELPPRFDVSDFVHKGEIT